MSGSATCGSRLRVSIFSSRSADVRTACAADATLGEAASSGPKSMAEPLGASVSQLRESKAPASGARARLATSSEERATSATALKFSPMTGTIDAKPHTGSSTAFSADVVCERICSTVRAAREGSLLDTASLSAGTRFVAAASSSFTADAFDQSHATTALLEKSAIPTQTKMLNSRRGVFVLRPLGLVNVCSGFSVWGIGASGIVRDVLGLDRSNQLPATC